MSCWKCNFRGFLFAVVKGVLRAFLVLPKLILQDLVSRGKPEILCCIEVEWNFIPLSASHAIDFCF